MSTPAVRFMAKKEGIDISTVTGTGKNGRVTKTDLINHMKTGGAQTTTQTTKSAPASGGNWGGYTGPRIHTLTGVTDEDT